MAPTDSTSHWLHGERSPRRAERGPQLVEYLTHLASAVYWAFPFELWLAEDALSKPLPLLGQAAANKQLPPPWTRASCPKKLTPGSLVAAYGAQGGRLGGRRIALPALARRDPPCSAARIT